jgi:protein phosphatase
MIPEHGAIRVVGDVHGDHVGWAHALATDRFVIQLGDLVDGGKDSALCLRMALDMQNDRRGVFLLGNHELKLLRALTGRKVSLNPELIRTLGQLDEELRAAAVEALAQAPAWLRAGNRFFVHGGFHPAMLHAPPPNPVPMGHGEGLLGRALFGQVTGRNRPDGYPDRLLHWVEDIPAEMICYVGHDWRSKDGRPWVCENRSGGKAVFLDTGAGKGGHLSWLDLQL